MLLYLKLLVLLVGGLFFGGNVTLNARKNSSFLHRIIQMSSLLLVYKIFIVLFEKNTLVLSL